MIYYLPISDCFQQRRIAVFGGVFQIRIVAKKQFDDAIIAFFHGYVRGRFLVFA